MDYPRFLFWLVASVMLLQLGVLAFSILAYRNARRALAIAQTGAVFAGRIVGMIPGGQLAFGSVTRAHLAPGVCTGLQAPKEGAAR